MPGVWPDKDPDDILDYGFDATGLIGDAADTITGSTATVVQGDVVVNQHNVSNGPAQRTVTWLSAGSPNTTHQVRIRSTTSLGRQFDETMTIKTTDR